MQLSGYNAAPALPCFEALNQSIKYVYHHPRVPVIHTRIKATTPSININDAKGEGEIIHIK